MKLNNEELNKTNVAEYEQHTINAQYTIIGDRSKNEAQGELNGTNCMKAKGDCRDCVRSNQMVLKTVRARRLDRMISGQIQLKGGHQAQSIQIRWFS
jgi:hypothetical protein